MILLLARVLLGATLLVAGPAKLRNPRRFAGTIMELVPRVPSRITVILAWTVPALEILCAIGLLGNLALQAAAVVAGGLLAVFTMIIASALLRGRQVSCACFGGSSATPMSWWSLARNMALLLSATLLAARPSMLDDPVAAAPPFSGEFAASALTVAAGWLVMALLVAAWRIRGGLRRLTPQHGLVNS